MVRLNTNGTLRYFTADKLSSLPFVIHAFCTRYGGVSNRPFSSLNVSSRLGDQEYNVAKNLSIIAGTFGFAPEQFCLVHQVHGDDIVVLDQNRPIMHSVEQPVYGDALIAKRSGVAIGIKTADCVPILIIDLEHQVIAAVHAGWKGTSLGLTAKVVKKMGHLYGTRPEHLLAAVGPAINCCCYEVDETVFRAFTVRERSLVFRPGVRPGRWMLDLPSANRNYLLAAGVPDGSIEQAEVCTACRRDWFFSHRGEHGLTGRQLSFIMIRQTEKNP
jgi:hypothetical protein